MARPRTIPDEQILDAARACFLDHGPAASTAAIAKAARVSEGLLFKRFGSKEGLFHAALGLPRCVAFEGLPERVGVGDLRETVQQISLGVIEFFRELMPRITMLRAHPNFDPLEMARDPNAPPLTALRALSAFFDAEMQLGRLRSCDPEVIARVLLGALHNYVFLETVGVHLRMPMAASSYVRALVDVLFSGVAPAPPEAALSRE